MIWLVGLVVGLVLLGSILAIAETSISRMTLMRAHALREEGWRTAPLLERIETEPPRYLNSVYLAVICVQNGSAILVALLADEYYPSTGVAIASGAFTLLYFLVVEAMAKTYGILHSDGAALATAPLVWWLSKLLALPTRLLVWLANVLLPGKGLRQGPWFLENEIRSLAEKGHEEGVLEEQAKEMIHSILEFRDTIVREVMVPRPDIVAIDVESPLSAVQDLIARHGVSRVPVYRGELDRVEGVVHAKDILQALQAGDPDLPLGGILRPARFTPESKRVADLLREMRQHRSHLALVTDEYGSVSGLVGMEKDFQASAVSDQLSDKVMPPEERVVRLAGQEFAVRFDGFDGGLIGYVNDGPGREIIGYWQPGNALFKARIDDEERIVQVARKGRQWRLTTRGAAYVVDVLPGHVALLSRHMIEKVPPDLSRFLICPMPGLLTRLDVEAGDSVEAGQPLAVVEAMKMENILRAEKSGTVKSVNAKPGDSLAVDAVILEFE